LLTAKGTAQELTGSSKELGKRILALIENGDAAQAHWGVQVVAVKDGKELVGWNADRLFVPASTAKLFPAAAALSRLGSDFKYFTTVEASQPVSDQGVLAGDLTLVGRGDPNLSGRVLPYNGRTERAELPIGVLRELAAEVYNRGVRTVEGSLIADDTYFVSQPYGGGWEIDDLQWGYGAPVSALAVNDNVTIVNVLPAAQAGEPALVRLEPLVDYYQIDNRVITVPRSLNGKSTAVKDESFLGLDRRPGTRLLRLWGQVPLRATGWRLGLALEDPARYAGELLREELAAAGVQVKGEVVVKNLHRSEVTEIKGLPHPPPAGNTWVVASHESEPLVESLKVMLKVSQNLHAEMLLRTLGRVRRNVGSVEAGLEEAKDFLKSIGIKEKDVLLKDGSGLTRQNLVTPSAMVTLLRAMHESEDGGVWTQLLPVAGRDGSLTDRLKGRLVAGRLRAKTGNLAEIAALAGYAANQDNEVLAFAIFVNHHNLTNGNAIQLVDRIAELIAASK
jgi:D-alanyl-D-alanine carboxypeptidase/D-alanyl-D-alanine-endopeptidase (penicillin-binding protein 4)